ncbi:hypothetical protein KZO01_20470 [Kurthia zopfii]|uniref:Protein of uncharacterized function (DUF3139) n=1 Tax=Kurthia zopfii TaxID=1650 RepID=A0A8B4QDC8_9BACL|nr:DUF3139 domain-containing protein [Kurthia zopfii]TDR38830.1 uncharacterized protein DUF3139 [Kurthia zopfii]GEK31738.1 hypothetical protein KZO01_20470 [Kurthia zopfii]STX10736.1 Protein of uncharacterised function (DUF3139) [Kurthia zopfii]
MKTILSIIAAILIVVIGFTIYVKDTSKQQKSNERLVERTVEQYLYEEKKYNKNEIKAISYKNNEKNNGEYFSNQSSVIFSDEPNNEYIYYVKKDDKRIQFIGFASVDPKIKPAHEKVSD